MADNSSQYCQAARFPSKQAAGAVYTPLQKLVLADENVCDLSVYRLMITEGWHVIVLGDTPPDTLHQKIEALLSRGTLVNLKKERPDVIAALEKRRSQIIPFAEKAEGHYDTEKK